MSRLRVAFIGMPNSGKSFAISVLAEYPDQLLKAAIAKKDSGTKVAIEYHFVRGGARLMHIEDLSLRDISSEDIPEEVRSVLLFDSGLKENTQYQLTKRIYHSDLRNLLPAKGIEKVIRKITVQVTIKAQYENLLDAHDLYIVDASCCLNGLLEWEKDYGQGQDKGKAQAFDKMLTPSDMGISNIDAAVLFCDEKLPKLYYLHYETLRCLLGNVPLYLLKRSKLIIPVPKYETYKSATYDLPISESHFETGFKFLAQCGIKDKDTFHSYGMEFYGKKSMIHCVPVCAVLNSSKDHKEILKDPSFKTLRFSIFALLEKIAKDSDYLNSSLAALLESKLFFQEIQGKISVFGIPEEPQKPNIIKDLLTSVTMSAVAMNVCWPTYEEDDILRDEESHKSSPFPLFPLPYALRSPDAVGALLLKGEFLGTLNGMPLLGLPWENPAVAILAGAAFSAIRHAISVTDLGKYFETEEGKELFPELNETPEKKETLVRLLLSRKLYSDFTEPFKYCQGCPTVLHSIASKAVFMNRRFYYATESQSFTNCVNNVFSQLFRSIMQI
jgi:hypothetical protein